jgi:hypothetical protein
VAKAADAQRRITPNAVALARASGKKWREALGEGKPSACLPNFIRNTLVQLLLKNMAPPPLNRKDSRRF